MTNINIEDSSKLSTFQGKEEQEQGQKRPLLKRGSWQGGDLGGVRKSHREYLDKNSFFVSATVQKFDLVKITGHCGKT